MRIGLVVNPMLMPLVSHLGAVFPWSNPNFKPYLYDFDLLLVQACCLYKTENYTNWGGMAFIKEVRHYKQYLPIVLTSWNPDLKRELSIRGSTLSRIFWDPLVKFSPISEVSALVNSEALLAISDSAQPTDHPYYQESLHSVMDTIYNDHFLIYEKIHLLKNEIDSKALSHAEKIKLIQRELSALEGHFNAILNLDKLKKLNLDGYAELDGISDEDQEGLHAFLVDYQRRFLNIVQNKPEQVLTKEKRVQKSIIYFDDVESEIAKLTQLLEPFEIKCFGAKTTEDGVRLLESVPNVVAVLSDFRMYDEWGRIQPMQGQFLLKAIQRTSPDLYYALLTAYSSSGNSDSGSLWENMMYTTNVDIYNKDNVFQQKKPDYHRLINKVLLAESIYSIKNEYATLLRDKGKKIYMLYLEVEKETAWYTEIGNIALQYIEEYQQGNFENKGFGKGALTFVKQHSSPEEREAQLKKQLLCRRVFMGLWQFVKDKKEQVQQCNQIYDFIFYENGPKSHAETELKNKQTSLNSALGLYTNGFYDLKNGVDELKKRTFWEEYEWLRINGKKLFRR